MNQIKQGISPRGASPQSEWAVPLPVYFLFIYTQILNGLIREIYGLFFLIPAPLPAFLVFPPPL
jgi:hypothetical protein